MKQKKAFTLAEAILTMTILGIIAAVMVATLRPGQYKQQGLDTLKKKIYSELDGVMQTYIVECAQDLDATKIYDGCDRASTTNHVFGTDGKNDLSYLQAHYMKGTYKAKNAANTGCLKVKTEPSLKLRNGACIYTGANYIKVDVNGNEGPNENAEDRMKIMVDANGLATDLDDALTSSW